MFGLFSNRDKILDDMMKRSERMEKYYLDKAVEYAKYAATDVDVDDMVMRFVDNLVGEHDSATINNIANMRAKDYRQ